MLRSGDLDGEEIRIALHNNLLLLGFDPERPCDPTLFVYNETKFDKETFKLPNHNAFQVMSRFLLLLHDPTTEDTIKKCWPVACSKNERDFRSICYKSLRKIAESDPDANFPRFSPSLFLSPGGKQFCLLYLAFSRYIMSTIIKRDFPEEVLLPFPKRAREVDLMRAATVVDLEQYKSNRKPLDDIIATFKDCAAIQSDNYWKISGENRMLENELKIIAADCGAKTQEEYYEKMNNFTKEVLDLKKMEVEKEWEKIGQYCSTVEKCHEIFENAIRAPEDRLTIDGKDLALSSQENPDLETVLTSAQKELSVFDERFAQFRDRLKNLPELNVCDIERRLEVGEFLPDLKQRLSTFLQENESDSESPVDSMNMSDPLELLLPSPDFQSYKFSFGNEEP